MIQQMYIGRVGLQQRVFPFYRAPFIDTLALNCTGGLGFFAGDPRNKEAIETGKKLENAIYTQANNVHRLKGPLYTCSQTNILEWLEAWQPDILIAEANSRYISTPQAISWMHTRSKPVIGWGLGSPAPKGWFASLRLLQRGQFVKQI